MEGVNIWENAEWTVQTRNIIKALKEFPENSKIILLLRHSHRNNPTASEKMHEMKLTPQGHQIATIFGQKLPISRSIRLFHSAVERCQETAEDILTGFGSVGGEGTLNGKLTPLFHAGTVYRWAVGFYSPDTIVPFQSYCQKAAGVIWNGIKDAQEGGIDIHVTHDIFLIALKYGWFGLPPDQDWVPFLGGVAFALNKNEIKLFDRDRFHSIPNPYWWKINNSLGL
ncbi:MAG: hypothetical protein ACTSQL_01510 [Promethearchaeota archaeon]